METRRDEILKEIALYTKYLRYKGFSKVWIRKVISTLKIKLKKREAQLDRYYARWQDYKKRGLI